MIELNRIYNEDCLIGMSRIPDKSVDAIVCDLPYGTTRNAWDCVIPYDKLWEQYNRIIKDNGAIVLFCQGMFTAQLLLSNPKMWRYNLVWKKGNRISGFLNANRQPLRNHEDIAVFSKKQTIYNPQMTIGNVNHARGGVGNGYKAIKQTNNCYDKFKSTATTFTNEKYPLSVIDIDRDFPSVHPTQKPVALIEYLIKTYSNEGNTILDNCMGSGTTAVACINTNRNYLGFEINPDYCNVAHNRIRAALQSINQPSLF